MSTTPVVTAAAPVSEPFTRPPVGADSVKHLSAGVLPAAAPLTRPADDEPSGHVD